MFTYSCVLLTILVHPPHVSDGADNRQAIGQLLLVLVMVLLQQRLSHPLSELISQR